MANLGMWRIIEANITKQAGMKSVNHGGFKSSPNTVWTTGNAGRRNRKKAAAKEMIFAKVLKIQRRTRWFWNDVFSLTTSWSAWIPWMLVSTNMLHAQAAQDAPEKSSLRSFVVQLMSRLKLWPTNVFQQDSLHATQASAEYQLQWSATWQWPQSGWLQPRSFSQESSTSIAVCHHQ